MSEGRKGNRNIFLIAAARPGGRHRRRRLSARRRAEARADGRPRGHHARPRRAQRHRRPRHLDDQLHRPGHRARRGPGRERPRRRAPSPTFFRAAGFPAEAVTDAGGSVNQFYDSNRGENSVTVNRRIQLRTNDVMRARRAYARQFDLIRSGVAIQEGSGDAIHLHPPERHQAGDDRRRRPRTRAAAPSSSPSDSRHRRRRHPLGDPGLFLDRRARRRRRPRKACGGSDSPFQKVRVVTTIEFYLD